MASGKKLSGREIKLVGYLLVILASLPFFLFTLPAWNEYSEISNRVDASKKQSQSLVKETSSLDYLKEENTVLLKKYERRKKYLAKQNEIDFLVQDLKLICDENEIGLESFTPTDIEPVNIILDKELQQEKSGKILNPKEYAQRKKKLKNTPLEIDLYKYPIDVKVSGNFTDILDTLAKLEKYGRAVSVANISIGKAGEKRNFVGGSDSRFGKGKKKKITETKKGLYGSFDLIAYSLPDENVVLPVSTLQKKSSFRFSKRK